MDLLSLDDILDIIKSCTHISADRKAELISIFKNASSEADVSADIFEELQKAVDDEIKSLKNDLTKLDEEIAKKKHEKKDIEVQNLPYVKKAAKAAVREMGNIMQEFTRDVTKIEDDAVKTIEKAKSSSDQSEVDAIRKKLGIA